MYVTNKTNTCLGIHGPVTLAAREKNRYIDDENLVLVESVMRLKAANLVSIVRDSGLIKRVMSTSVKTVTVDTGAIGNKPRSSESRVEEVLGTSDPTVQVEEAKEDVVEAVEAKEEVAEVVEETAVEEAPAEELVNEEADKSNKKKKKK